VYRSLAAPATEFPKFDAKVFILDDIPANFDSDLMTAKLRPGSARVEKNFRNLIEQARLTARPRAVGRVCDVELSSPQTVSLDGVRFSSELLHCNLSGLNQAYVYVASEGPEMAAWAASLSETMRLFAWPIRYAALKLAEKALADFIRSTFGLEQISSMHPGSLSLWPLQEQKPLFSLLSPLPEAIGVELQPKLWMTPDMASSGIFFETEVPFENCQLCPLETCEHRRVPNRGEAGWPKPKISFKKRHIRRSQRNHGELGEQEQKQKQEIEIGKIRSRHGGQSSITSQSDLRSQSDIAQTGGESFVGSKVKLV
jgi:hypothetical protein